MQNNYWFKRIAMVAIASFLLQSLPVLAAPPAQVSDSTRLNPSKPSQYMSYQGYVDTNNCVTLTSSPYVIILGNGGADMRLTCPADHPVMVNWNFQVGYGGLLVVQDGGGVAKAQCCAVAHQWTQTQKQPA